MFNFVPVRLRNTADKLAFKARVLHFTHLPRFLRTSTQAYESLHNVYRCGGDLVLKLVVFLETSWELAHYPLDYRLVGRNL